MFGDNGIGGRVNRLASLQAYRNKGNRDGSADACSWADFDFAFYSGLERSFRIDPEEGEEFLGRFTTYLGR